MEAIETKQDEQTADVLRMTVPKEESPEDALKKASALIDAANAERSERCAKAVEAILAQFGCVIDAQITLNSRGVLRTVIEFVPQPQR
jgi:phage gp36-like protein